MATLVPIKDVPKPEGSLWTDEQWQAITARGKNILVAAAAGSGKTAVLVERIIRRITDADDPVDVDRMLVVTFTNAAAAEMKKRIGEALEKELREQPESLYLKRQLTLLNQASISTLHSFCLDVLRAYYFQLDLDPKFRIAEDTEIALIKEEVLEELFEERYGREDDELFFKLVDSFSSDRSDQDLQTLVLQVYDFCRSHPFPQEWLKEMLIYTDESKVKRWAENVLTIVRQQLKGLAHQLEQALELIRRPGGPTAYAINLEEDLNLIHTLLAACQSSWGDAYTTFGNQSFGRLKSSKGEDVDPLLQVRVKEIRDRVKKDVTNIKEEYFQRTMAENIEDLVHMAPLMETLVQLVLEFDQRFSQVKRKKAILDFSDLEHYCLGILRNDRSTMEELIPSEAANKYQQKFIEILVDEYQDTNLVQEAILKLISRQGGEQQGNVFMVGDVKQSIYRFRMAEPSLFLQKYKLFESITTPSSQPAGEQTGWRIDLAKNFRSRSQVLDGTNYLFKQIMDEQVGEISYDTDAELKLGATYPEDDLPIELALIDRDTTFGEEEDVAGAEGATGGEGEASAEENDGNQALNRQVDEMELETVQLEARFMAKKIKEMIRSGPEDSFQVFDPKLRLYRPIQYKDIVILLRASAVWAPAILEEFKEQGIPAYAELTTGYFEATEVAIMLSLLKIIDNPYQDIPLASVLRSPIVGLQGDDLARLRVVEKNANYYEAVRLFLQQSEENSQTGELYEKVKAFVQRLKGWRERARHGSLAELIWQLYRETGYYDYVGGMPGGNQRQANLRALYDRARQYEATSFRGLFRFLRFIERMRDRGSDLGTARALSEQEDVVRIMTIHKSKGLEFPVVFVAGLGKMFNQSDLKKKLLLHKELGLGSKVIDVDNRISYPTLPYQLIKYHTQQEMLAEEMRVLYVALTRAKEKLILLGTLKDVRKKVNQWSQVLTANHANEANEANEWTLPDSLRSQARSYLDWIGPAVIRHQDAHGLLEFADHEPEQDYRNLEESIRSGIGEHSRLFARGMSEITEDSSAWDVHVVSSHDLTAVAEAQKVMNEEKLHALSTKTIIDRDGGNEADEIARRLDWSYSFPMATTTKAKQSVTELKRQYQWLLEESQEPQHSLFQSHFQGRPSKPDRPRFMQTRTLTSAESGTAMHTVLQHMTLGKPLSESDISPFIKQLVKQEKLTPEEAGSIKLEQLVQFTNSPVNEWFAKASVIYREVPFTFSLSAKEVFAQWDQSTDERVIIQGIIDSLCQVDGQWIMVDYKTDAINNRFRGGFDEARPFLLERYRVQMLLYTQAVEEICKVSVDKKLLYFFDGGHILEI